MGSGKARAKRKLGGKWSARAAQLAVSYYKKSGGGYSGPKKASNSLSKWTKQKWRTRDGKKAKRKGGTARYLPDAAWKSMSKAEARATDRKKRAGSRKGKGGAKSRKAKAAGRGHDPNGNEETQAQEGPSLSGRGEKLSVKGWWPHRQGRKRYNAATGQAQGTCNRQGQAW